MSDIINVDIQEENPIEIIEIYVDENAAQSAADSAELAQQIVAGIDQRNTILVNNNFDKTGTVFTGYANSEWNINGLVYLNPEDVIHNIPLAVSGKQRWERIVLNTSNSFQRVPGDEVTDNPAMPSVPDDTLEYTFYLVTDSAVGDPTPPIVGSNYQSKGEKADAIYSLGTFEYIGATEASNCRIQNQTTGFLKSIRTYSGNTNLYPGKDYTVKNETGLPLTLKHQDITLVGLDYKKFWFPTATDFILQNGESANFRYTNGRLELNGFNRLSKRQWAITTPAFQFLNVGSGNWFKKPTFNTSYLTINQDTGFTDKASLSIHTVDFVAPFNCYLKEVEILTAGSVDFSVVIHKSDNHGTLNEQEIYYKASANTVVSETVSSGVMVKKGGGISIWLKQLGTLTTPTKYGKMTLILEEA